MSFSIGQTASSSSSSSRNTAFFPGWKYDVFLSFRGEDTRRNFTDHLHKALVDKGICTFRDDEGLERGEIIDQNLLQAIEESRNFIIIFSKNYANSESCLNELVKIMECRAERKAVPIFYHVDPSEVEKQSGKYGEAFEVYEKNANLEREQIRKWRTALTEASNLAGHHIHYQYETEMVKKITTDMLREIIGKHCNEDGLVGEKPRLEALKELISKPKDVLMVGIYGLGGIGKTAIARALYDEISGQFEGASFLANIGEVSKKDDLYCLQKRLFCDILFRESQEIRPFHRRNKLMKDKIRCKKVLIILDEVNDMKQLQILAGKHDWFGKGSRIVITTRNKLLLHEHKVDEFYEPEGLDRREALELFSHHANTNEESLYCFCHLSKQIIECYRQNPLALQVVGSFLRGKNWHWKLKYLAGEYARENLNILRVSYNGLSRQEQSIFLDVACFFKGEHKDFATKMLDGHDLSAEDGVKVLADRCLITISERKLWMHSILQNLGWQIVREASKPSRFFDHMNIQRLLRTKKGIREVEGISLDLSKSKDIDFSTEAFEKMTELKLLKVFLGSDCVDGKENYKVNLSTDFGLRCSVLRYLHWHGYQLESYPPNFEAVELLELNMPYSCLKQITGNEIYFPKLTTLNLSHSQHLENISNFSRMPNLERLVLEGCRSLVNIDPSIGDLSKLSFMNLKDCKALNSLPNSICKLKFLDTLILVGCSRLEKLLGDWEERQSSVNLMASRTYRSSYRGEGTLPRAMRHIAINCSYPISLREIPVLVQERVNPRILLRSNLCRFPGNGSITPPPPKLRILHLGHCKRLRGISKLPSSIQEVDAYNCPSMPILSWKTGLGASILQRIKMNPESAFSIVLPGNTIPDCWVTHKVTESSVTMKLQKPEQCNDAFLGFAVCLVFAPQAERPQLNPEILCELNNFSFFYCCGEDSVESDQERGSNSTDHVWLAYRPHARADRCHPEEWKPSFEVIGCEVKEYAIWLCFENPTGLAGAGC